MNRIEKYIEGSKHLQNRLKVVESTSYLPNGDKVTTNNQTGKVTVTRWK